MKIAESAAEMAYILELHSHRSGSNVVEVACQTKVAETPHAHRLAIRDVLPTHVSASLFWASAMIAGIDGLIIVR